MGKSLDAELMLINGLLMTFQLIVITGISVIYFRWKARMKAQERILTELISDMNSIEQRESLKTVLKLISLLKKGSLSENDDRPPGESGDI